MVACRRHDTLPLVPEVLIFEQPHSVMWPHAQQPEPTLFIPIDIDAKLAAYARYVSQIRGHRSPATVAALAALRGAQIMTPHAEAYQARRIGGINHVSPPNCHTKKSTSMVSGRAVFIGNSAARYLSIHPLTTKPLAAVHVLQGDDLLTPVKRTGLPDETVSCRSKTDPRCCGPTFGNHPGRAVFIVPPQALQKLTSIVNTRFTLLVRNRN